MIRAFEEAMGLSPTIMKGKMKYKKSNQITETASSQQIVFSQQTNYRFSQRTDSGLGGTMGSNLEDMQQFGGYPALNK